jgi:ABC-type lipoprotein export system ATPase subunit
MIDPAALLSAPLPVLRARSPKICDFLIAQGVEPDESGSLGQWLARLSPDDCEDQSLDKAVLIETLCALAAETDAAGLVLRELTLLGGRDKFGRPEDVQLAFAPGSTTSIVGPTGSGKSRLLADIEWMAQGDTPTGRHILLNGAPPDPELRFSLEHKPVAQLSQNMNFVVDATVGRFIEMHALSRKINAAHIVAEIVTQANLLVGEPFAESTAVTALSGGQSRALMIADTAFLSASPVVLIDEIENAGIDRKQALDLLIRKEKIVLMATHDPILALMAARRLTICDGRVTKVLTTSAAECALRGELEVIDARLGALRARLRAGETIDSF